MNRRYREEAADAIEAKHQEADEWRAAALNWERAAKQQAEETNRARQRIAELEHELTQAHGVAQAMEKQYMAERERVDWLMSQFANWWPTRESIDAARKERDVLEAASKRNNYMHEEYNKLLKRYDAMIAQRDEADRQADANERALRVAAGMLSTHEQFSSWHPEKVLHYIMGAAAIDAARTTPVDVFCEYCGATTRRVK